MTLDGLYHVVLVEPHKPAYVFTWDAVDYKYATYLRMKYRRDGDTVLIVPTPENEES